MSRSVFRTLSAFALLGFVALIVGAQAPPPAPPLTAEEKTAKIVVNLLERAHMAKPTIDDEIAKKWCKTFIKDLDPQKIYFLKADVDEFLPQATNLDDLVKKGNIDFAKDVFKRFLKRSDERLAMVQDIVKQKPDFTIDESMSDDAEKMDYPVTDDEARERMRKRVKLELLQAKVDGDNEEGQGRGRRQEALGPISRPEPDGPPVHHVRLARVLPYQPQPDVRPAHELHEQGLVRRLHEPVDPALPDWHRRLAPVRGRLRGRQGADPRRPRRQGRPPPARGQDPRHRAARRDRDRLRREAAQGRRPPDPWRGQHPRPPDHPASRLEGSQDHTTSSARRSR